MLSIELDSPILYCIAHFIGSFRLLVGASNLLVARHTCSLSLLTGNVLSVSLPMMWTFGLGVGLQTPAFCCVHLSFPDVVIWWFRNLHDSWLYCFANPVFTSSCELEITFNLKHFCARLNRSCKHRSVFGNSWQISPILTQLSLDVVSVSRHDCKLHSCRQLEQVCLRTCEVQVSLHKLR